MKTLFKKDENDLGRITTEFDTENKWVLINSIPYRKLDGTACMIKDGELYKRYDAKIDKVTGEYKKPIPEGAISCQEPDILSGHHPHWIKCSEYNPQDKWHILAFDSITGNLENGTYELVGEKINGNPEDIEGVQLINHKSMLLEFSDFDISRANEYGYVKDYLSPLNVEGIVFRESGGDKMCKIRKKDFGLKRKKLTRKLIYGKMDWKESEKR